MKSSVIKIVSLITLFIVVLLYFFLRSQNANPEPPTNLQAIFLDTSGNAQITWDESPGADAYRVTLRDFVTDSVVYDSVVTNQAGTNVLNLQVAYKKHKVEVRTIIDAVESPPATTTLDIIIIEDVVVMRPASDPIEEELCPCSFLDENPTGAVPLVSGDIYDVSNNLTLNQREILFIKVKKENDIIYFKLGVRNINCEYWDVEICGKSDAILFCDETGATLQEESESNATRLKFVFESNPNFECFMKTSRIEGTNERRIEISFDTWNSDTDLIEIFHCIDEENVPCSTSSTNNTTD